MIVFIITGLSFTKMYIPVYIFSIEGKSGTPIKVVISTCLDFEHFFPARREATKLYSLLITNLHFYVF